MSVTTTDLWRMSALELAEIIRSRQASSQEVIEAHLPRIAAVNPSVNAVTVVLGEQALEAAKAADRAAAGGLDLPPLHGVPFTVKGNIDLAGTPTTQGLRALSDAYPSRDAPVVERLKAAGAIATGMSPLGLGNDMLGSLRWPAQCCGICVLKPTLGRIPDATTAGQEDAPIGVQLAAVQGPMARRVADLRAAFEVLAGLSWRDPWSVSAPLRGPEPAKPARVALVVDPVGHGIARQVQEGVRKAARALEDAGYAVEEIEPPSIDLAAKTVLDMLSTPDLRAGWQMMSHMWPPDTNRFLSAFYEVAGDPDPVTTMQSFMVRHSLLRVWGEFQLTHPLIVAPIYTDIPFEAGQDLGDGRVAETIRGMRMAIAVNALGLPAVALPVGIGDGLPQVVQVIGPRYREDLCLDAAAAIEERVGIITPIDPR